MKRALDSRRFDDTWLWESLAVSSSVLSIVAIIIVLIHFDGQPVFDWNGITLNAIVAVFATIAKASLAFTLSACMGQAKWIWFSSRQRPLEDLNLIDGGSRGPLGSLKMLTHPVARSFITLGALTVILSAAIDSFAQLAVGKKTVVTFGSDSSVQIPFAKRYSKGISASIEATSELFPDGNNNYTATQSDADLAMKSAVYYGISQTDISVSQQLQGSCSSGNCTWDIFTSLAVCSACNNLNDSLKKTIIGTTDAPSAPLSVYLKTLNEGAEAGTDITEYSLPNGLRLNNLPGQPSQVYMTAFGTSNESTSISFSAKDTLIWSMTIMKVTDVEVNWEDTPVVAAECGLWYCVNSYNSSVENSTISETITPAPSARSPASWEVLPQQPVGVAFDHPPPNTIGYNASLASVNRTDLQLGDGFNVSQSAIWSIGSFISSTFQSSQLPPTEFINAWVIKESGDLTIYRPTAMQMLYTSQDWEATFATLAKSMTNVLRQDSDGAPVVLGKAGNIFNLINVHWWFLILPIALTLAGAIFLIMVIYYTHRASMSVWSSNLFPVMALGNRVGPIFDDVKTTSRMDDLAKSQHVRFPSPNGDSMLNDTTSPNRRGEYEMVAPVNVSRETNASQDAVSQLSEDELGVVEREQC